MSRYTLANRPVCPPSPALPPPEMSLWTSYGRVSVFRHADAIPAELWEAFFPPQHKDLRYYKVLEETMSSQFEQRYLLLEDPSGRARAIQPVFFSQQDLLAEFPAALRPMGAAMRKLFPGFLRSRILMAGCTVGDGQLGGSEEHWEIFPEALRAALEVYARKAGASIIVLKDLPTRYRSQLESLESHYARMPSFPAVKLDLEFESFEDYMAKKLGKETRRDLRRKLKKSAELGPIECEVVSDISPYASRIHELYLEVARRSSVQFDVLTQDYFRLVGQRIPDRARFFLWRQAGRIIAFSFCMIDGDDIYDNDIGFDYSVALDLHLYFVTRRDTFQWAIDNGFKTYHCSPYNYEPKLRMGFELVPLDLYVRHVSPLINPFLRRIAPSFALPKSDPILSRLPNAAVMWAS